MINITLRKALFTGAMALACSLIVNGRASAQSASFIYNDGNGTPDAGTYTPGQSFTFSINLAFTPGGNVSNLDGLSYWFQQKSPGTSPFNFAITLRDTTGSMFTDLQTSNITYPQNLAPSNPNDLGALLPGSDTPLGTGTYLIADITVSISPNAPITGTYVLSETLTGGKTSIITDSLGHTLAIAEADYTITMVPEPATWMGAALVATLLLCGAVRRRGRAQIS